MYLPLSEGSWEHRRFYSLDLLEQDPVDVSRRFVEFLSKARVISGDALVSAKRVFDSAHTENVLRDALPRAWAKLLTDPDDGLVNLLIETTERMCGLRPELADVERFLSGISSQQQPQRRLAPRAPVANGRVARSAAPAANGHDFINKKIESFVLFGDRHSVGTWQEMLLTVARELYHRYPLEFDRCLSLRGTTMPYFSKSPSDLKDLRQVGDSGYYAESKLNSNSVVRRSMELLHRFGHGDEDLQIVVK